MVTSFFNHKKKTLPGRNATITSSGIWGSCHLLHPARRGRPLPTTWYKRSSAPYGNNAKISIDIINMIALKDRCQRAIGQFSGFPAASLPRLRFGRKIVYKILIMKTFRFRASLKKNFFPEFPRAAGKGRGVALPCCLSSFRRRCRVRLDRGLLLLAFLRLTGPGVGARPGRLPVCSDSGAPTAAIEGPPAGSMDTFLRLA